MLSVVTNQTIGVIHGDWQTQLLLNPLPELEFKIAKKPCREFDLLMPAITLRLREELGMVDKDKTNDYLNWEKTQGRAKVNPPKVKPSHKEQGRRSAKT